MVDASTVCAVVKHLLGGKRQTREIIRDEAKFSLKTVLQSFKSRLLPGIRATEDEFRKWKDMIYAANWQPGQFCEGANDPMSRRSVNDCAFTFGTLRETLEASPKPAGRAPASQLLGARAPPSQCTESNSEVQAGRTEHL